MYSESDLQVLAEMFSFIPKPILGDILASANGDVELAANIIMRALSEETDNTEYDNDEAAREAKTGIILIGDETGDCGYCKKKKTSQTYYSELRSITPRDLQSFCDLNWRRSGVIIYKPLNQNACCPYYTIRLPVEKFVPAKDHRTVLRNMERYLETGSIKAEEPQKSVRKAIPELSPEERGAIDNVKPLLQSAVSEIYGDLLRSAGVDPSSIEINFVHNPESAWKARGKVSCNVAVALAGIVKKMTKGKTQISPKEVVDKIAGYITSNKAATLEVPFVVNGSGFINFFVSKGANSNTHHEPTEKKAKIKMIHDNLNEKGVKGVNGKKEEEEGEHKPAHKIEYVIKKSEFDKEEYEIYRKYQINIHKDPPSKVTEKGYIRFLVESPIVYTPIGGELPLGVTEYGTYHLQYKIDGKVVGVSVLDILPKSLSSVYFFYDTDYEFLQLGKYSALWEIRYISDIISKHVCGIEYYYLGYYIPTIKKMKYKGQYKPSELLCEKTREWVPLDTALPIIEKAIGEGKAGLVDIDPSAEPRNVPTEEEIDALLKDKRQIRVGILSRNRTGFDQAHIQKVVHDFILYTNAEIAKGVEIEVYIE